MRKFFDTLDHGHLRAILQQRVRDGVLLRLIGKWLKAGVLEEGELSRPSAGSPQGGVISPMLANIYLHEVLDRWFERTVRPRLRGQGFMIRYADDVVMVFSCEVDAQRVMKVLPERFGRYGLTLHPEKTKLVAFLRPKWPSEPPGSGGSQAGTFNLLGFTHFWARARKGGWVIKRKTASDRFSRALRAVASWCRDNRHLPIADQHGTLSRKLRGHFGYYGITGNSQALSRFRYEVERAWKKWLSRRSQRAHNTWDCYAGLLAAFPLPPPVAVHSVLRHAAKP
jgi:RNA-directed DNA polymerase